MSIKKKVIKQAISKIERRIKKIDSIIYANPASRIIEIRQEAQKIMIDNKGDYEKISKLIEPLAKEEKKQFALYKNQSKNQFKLMDEKAEISLERDQLISELYFIERSENQTGDL